MVKLTKETHEKVKQAYMLIQHHKDILSQLETLMRRLVQEETGIEDGTLDLEKGIVVNGSTGK